MPNQNTPNRSLAERIARTRNQIQKNSGSDQQLRNRLDTYLEQRQSRRGGGGGNGAAPGGGTTGTSGGGGGPYSTPMSATYATDIAQASADLQFAQQNAAYDRATTEREYGFNDPSDPFNRANQLQHDYEAAQRGTLNNYASSGQLYAGSLNNANALDRREYDEGYHALRQDYEARLREIALGEATAQRQYDSAVAYAHAGNLDTIASTPVDPAEAAPPPVDGGGGGGGGGRPPKPGPNFEWDSAKGHWVRTGPAR